MRCPTATYETRPNVVFFLAKVVVASSNLVFRSIIAPKGRNRAPLTATWHVPASSAQSLSLTIAPNHTFGVASQTESVLWCYHGSGVFACYAHHATSLQL